VNLIRTALIGAFIGALVGLGIIAHSVDTLRTELAQTREIAEAARINTVENGRNLAVVREQWNLKHNDRIEFTVRVGEGGE
jgi:hypothetical protein